MSIKSELHRIEIEINAIQEAKERIALYRNELNKFNPFKVGETLIGNDYTHKGKEFVVDKTYVSSHSNTIEVRQPKRFVAEGYIKLKSGELGSHRTIHSIDIAQK